MNQSFWKGRKVFLTGHTGFKGGWTALLLSQMGAKVYGYSLKPPTKPNFFMTTKLEKCLSKSTIANILDLKKLTKEIKRVGPSLIIHMAAQPLVRESYNMPLQTLNTNIIGTANIFEAARQTSTIKAIVNITTDKCYENLVNNKPLKENDRLGGYDPYSSSKACAELITSAYRRSFLSDARIHVASVRAGNVIGGGDWAEDRLIPDFFKSVYTNKTMIVRSPNAIRPWQHVLEPISGYLLLAEKLIKKGRNYASAWNFGPENKDAKTVGWVVDQLCAITLRAKWKTDDKKQPHETAFLKLDNTKAKKKLNWKPRWNIKIALSNTVKWYQYWKNGYDMLKFSQKQIEQFHSHKKI